MRPDQDDARKLGIAISRIWLGECPEIGGIRGTRLVEGLQLFMHSSSHDVAGGTQKRFAPQSLDSPRIIAPLKLGEPPNMLNKARH
jgi:hypothetical protein